MDRVTFVLVCLSLPYCSWVVVDWGASATFVKLVFPLLPCDLPLCSVYRRPEWCLVLEAFSGFLLR